MLYKEGQPRIIGLKFLDLAGPATFLFPGVRHPCRPDQTTGVLSHSTESFPSCSYSYGCLLLILIRTHLDFEMFFTESHIWVMLQQDNLVVFSSLLILVSSHWLPPSALSRQGRTSHREENDMRSNLGVLRRSERDIDHCGPDDPVPPNRVNTSVQVIHRFMS